MNNLHPDFYEKLKDCGHYQKALETEFYSEDIGGRVVEHICIGTLYQMDKFEGGLLSHLVANGSNWQIKKAISVFSYRSLEGKEINRDCIKLFWNGVYDRYNEKDDIESKKVLVDLADLQKHFSTISENFTLLKASFRHCSVDNYPYALLEILSDYVEKEPNFVADLLIETLESDYYFTYRENLLQNIIIDLYKANLYSKADRVCIAYISKGIDWLRETYDKYTLRNEVDDK